MSPIIRTWLATAAFSAGLVHLALVVSSPAPFAIALGALGLLELGWGVAAFARDDLPVPSVARAVAFTPVVLWSLLVVMSTLLDAPALTAPLTLVPMIVATAFELFAAAVLSVHLRRSNEPATARAASPAPASAVSHAPAASATRYLLGITAGALIAASLVTPALSATEAGRYAQPHGEHREGVAPAPQSDDPLAVLDLGDHGSH